jgi:hypothetical protein
MGIARAAIRVLFIGNSLTATNDVPAIVERLGQENSEQIVTKTVASPNFSLEDHWNQGDARKAVAEGGWSFVVLQQGPSARPESRALLVEYAKRFAAEARKVNARVALYMVWPSSARLQDFDGVKLSYETAAREIGGLFLPAGDAWRVAWGRDAKLGLYGSDGFHPSEPGSYLAALVIYRGLTGKPAARLAAGRIREAEARLLHEAAAAVRY